MITYEPPIQIDEMAWRIRWTSDVTPPVTFKVFIEGVLASPDGIVSHDGAGSWVLSVPPGEFPFFEVLDTDCIPSIAFSGHLLLQWYGTGNHSYRVEKYNGASWDLQEILVDDGRGYFSWRSPWLADVTVHTYRIVPVSSANNQGTPLSLVSLMVRHPDSPNVEVTYNGDILQTIHIEAV
jgi:hypothetical protein